jgi:hypothetical protein
MRALRIRACKYLRAGAAFVLFLTGLTPAYSQISQTFGRITEAATPSGGLTADHKRASRFTLPGRGTVTSLCAYLDGNGGGGSTWQEFSLVLYTDKNGAPDAKIFETSHETITSGSPAAWFCRSAGVQYMDHPLFSLPAGDYWIAIQTGVNAGVIRDYGDGPPNWYSNADALNDGASATFGAGTQGTVTLSVYAEYFPDSQLRHAGRMTVGSTPSGGMTADFKRGSSFTMPERGKLYAISAYLDGGGGSSPVGTSQALHYIIYQDANGFPGAKLYEGGDIYVSEGNAGMWVPEYAGPPYAPTLDAGRYWITLLTGATGGVARNYGDGAPGNWYGNSDLFSDRGSDQFGPGNPGNGTISAFISYRPGTITSGQVGRTDVGTKPSGGLSANFIRWSQFRTDDINATLTGLHAYLDGLGGASGTQQVRMVIYGEYYDQDQRPTYLRKLAQSPAVAIAAGMQPQWVHFSVPSVPLDATFGHYLIAIQSGDTAGVVRDYGDGRLDPGGNWAGENDAFSDGASQDLSENPVSTGTGTLSVYATYSLPPP